MGFKVIEIQSTPNPNALKFVLDREISSSPASFFEAASAASHPIAFRLFHVAGVSSLLLLGDFVTVNKRPESKWAAIRSKVERILAEA